MPAPEIVFLSGAKSSGSAADVRRCCVNICLTLTHNEFQYWAHLGAERVAKPFLCRVGLAQISFNPAYMDELASYIQEPAFPGEHDKTGLFSISGLEEVGQFQSSVAEKYLLHLNHKIESIVRFASSDGVELLVFPEYSIPPEALPLCHALSQELGIAIVAGSHVVTLSDAARQIYQGLNLTFEGSKKPVEERVRQAACVVFVPDETPVAFVKYVRSKWEGSLVEGVPAYHAFQMKTRNGKIEVQILICIEALSHATIKEKNTIPRLVAIPAFTPRTDPFYDEGRHALLTGKCTLFANVTEFGGSRVFARADNTSLWFTEKNGSKPLPKGSEALLVVEADLEKQFEVNIQKERGTFGSICLHQNMCFDTRVLIWAPAVRQCNEKRPDAHSLRSPTVSFECAGRRGAQRSQWHTVNPA
jgi:hypothetical protein